MNKNQIILTYLINYFNIHYSKSSSKFSDSLDKYSDSRNLLGNNNCRADRIVQLFASVTETEKYVRYVH